MEQLRPVGLEKLDVTVVELPEWEKRPDGCIVQYTGWGEIEPYRFGEMALLEKKLPVNLLRSLASHWVELQQENATLRAVLNGKLVSAPECLYYRSKISRNYWLFEPKCRNNAEIIYTQRLQIASYFP